MTRSVAYGGHIFILKSRVAVSCMIDYWDVLNALSKFWSFLSLVLASKVVFFVTVNC